MIPLLLSLLLPSAAAEHPLVLGQTFPMAPRHLGPLLENPGDPSVEAIQGHLEAHDLDAALWEATRLTERHPWGRDRDIAWMVQGLIHREEGRHNLASAAFTKARITKGPLKPIATYYEAEQDLERGKYFVAARECATYRETWPRGRHAQDCHRVMAIAYARAGAWSKARSTARSYDAQNSHAPIGEQVDLTLTLQLLREAPEKAVGRLQDHSVDFTAPLTGRIAMESLAALREQGIDAPTPMDVSSRQRRARSLRNTKQTHAAWDVFADLVMDADDDPELMRWVEANADTFGWRTRNWDFLEKLYAADYADRPSGELAWKRYRVLTRGGRYAEAIEAAKLGLEKHGRARHWRNRWEALGQTFMLGGDYTGARDHFDAMAGLGGWTGRRGRFYAAFSAFMAGDDDENALERLTAVVERNGSYSLAARYWRARLLDRLEKPDEAAVDRAAVVEADPDSWYGALVRADAARGDGTLQPRDGTWPGTPWQDPPEIVQGEAPSTSSDTFAIGTPAPDAVHDVNTGFGLLQWAGMVENDRPEPAPAFLKADPDLPPPSYTSSALFDPAAATARLHRWAQRHAGAWPELEAAFELARGGLYDHSGPLFSAIYEEWRAAYRNRANRKHAAARAMKLDPDGWRDAFKVVRDHHHTARFHHSVWESMEDPGLAREAKRIAYPLAHDRYVWSHAREHGVDPYLVLGLMRQESTYNSIARSPVGARGAMQIMPRTGHLVANITHDLQYDAGDLEDPTFAVGHGIRYLGLLMERFDDAYPLAIASYNGGPFNVSSWRKGTGTEMPMDAFVEHIPFRETRNYVKRVSAGYSAYLSLYAQPGTLLVPPETPRGDHEDVIDF